MNTHKHLIFLVFHVNFYTISIKNVALIAFFFLIQRVGGPYSNFGQKQKNSTNSFNQVSYSPLSVLNLLT